MMEAGKFLRSGAILVGALALLASAGAATNAHTVRRGDTIGEIARRHQVAATALVAMNDLEDADRVRAGATLRIPDRSAAEVASAVPIATRSAKRPEYVVRAGDTLSSIALRHATTVDALVQENGLETPRATLAQGRALRVPTSIADSDDEAALCPVKGAGKFDFSNSFGAPREGRRKHGGNDIFAKRGTPVIASVAGTVRSVKGDNVGIGYYLDGDDGVTYYGAHLAKLAVDDGPVDRGDVIGAVGASGNARGTPPHLHFEVKPRDGASVDPYGLLRKWCR